MHRVASAVLRLVLLSSLASAGTLCVLPVIRSIVSNMISVVANLLVYCNQEQADDSYVHIRVIDAVGGRTLGFMRNCMGITNCQSASCSDGSCGVCNGGYVSSES